MRKQQAPAPVVARPDGWRAARLQPGVVGTWRFHDAAIYAAVADAAARALALSREDGLGWYVVQAGGVA